MKKNPEVPSAPATAGDHETRIRGLELRSVTPGRRPTGFYQADPVGGNPIASGIQSVYMLPAFAGFGGGTDLIDVYPGAAASWTVKAAGVYCFMARIGMDPVPGAVWPANNVMHMDLSPQGADPAPANFWATEATSTFPLSNTSGASINTIYAMRYMTPEEISTGGYWSLHISWNYIGAVAVSGFLEVIRLA